MGKSDSGPSIIVKKRSFAPDSFYSMNEICRSELDKLDVSIFEYARVYDDGTACLLYTDHAVANYVISKEIHISAHVPEEIIETDFWFLPDTNSRYSLFIKEIKDLSNASSFANYIRRSVGFYEMYSFWKKEEQRLASNKFMNTKELLERFCLDFNNRARHLILSVDSDRFKLTESMLPNFRGIDSDEGRKKVKLLFYLEMIQHELNIVCSHVYPRLSKQEIKCIYFLFEGRTALNIASLLNISQRTVEMHINSIKLKLNCSKKSDIISLIISLAKKHRL